MRLLKLSTTGIPDIQRMLDDPAYFVNEVMGIELYPYQVEFLQAATTHKRMVLAWGRQSGKTTAVASLSIWWALTHPGTDLTPYTILIVSRGLRQAFIMFRTVRYLISGNPILEALIDNGKTTRSEIWFRNKSRIIALPSGHDGSTIRGYTAHVLIMDEAAYIKEHIINEVALPMLATTERRGGGVAILLSTPAGRDHPFYNAFMSPHYWKSRIPSRLCPNITAEFLKERENEDPWGYRQEYEVEFMDDTTSWFPMKLLNERVIDKMDTEGMVPEWAVAQEEVETGKKYDHLYGCDLGKIKSHSVIVVVRKEMGKDGILRYRVVYLHEFPLVVEETAELFQSVEDWTYKIGRCFKLQRGAVDATNNLAFAEKVRQKLPVIEPIRFTEQTKQDMMTWLRSLMEQGRIIIPYNHRLVSQLNGEQFEVRGDKLIFSAPKHTTEHGSVVIANDDMVMALALALYTERTPTKPPMVVTTLH